MNVPLQAIIGQPAAALVRDSFLTGSQAIAPWAAWPKSDLDIVLLIPEFSRLDPLLTEAGFKSESGAYVGCPEFMSYRRDQTNLILVQNTDAFKRWRIATQTAKRLKLATRDERVVLFRAILYGEAPAERLFPAMDELLNESLDQ